MARCFSVYLSYWRKCEIWNGLVRKSLLTAFRLAILVFILLLFTIVSFLLKILTCLRMIGCRTFLSLWFLRRSFCFRWIFFEFFVSWLELQFYALFLFVLVFLTLHLILLVVDRLWIFIYLPPTFYFCKKSFRPN